MSDNIEEKPFSFSIERIVDSGFFVREQIEVQEDKIKLGYRMVFLFDDKNNWIEYTISADFKETDTNITFAYGSTLTRFYVPDLSRFIDENKKVNFPPNSLETLFSISFTHMRAILSKNIAGSKYANLVVPVINPYEVFNELLQANIEKAKKMREELNKNNEQ